MNRQVLSKEGASNGSNGFTPIETVRIGSDVLALIARQDDYVRHIVRDVLISLARETFQTFLSRRSIVHVENFETLGMVTMRVGGVTLDFVSVIADSLIELVGISTPGFDDRPNGGAAARVRPSGSAGALRDALDLIARVDIAGAPASTRKMAGQALRRYIGASPVMPLTLIRLLKDIGEADHHSWSVETGEQGGLVESWSGQGGAWSDFLPRGDFSIARADWQVADLCHDLTCFSRDRMMMGDGPLAPCPQVSQSLASPAGEV